MCIINFIISHYLTLPHSFRISLRQGSATSLALEKDNINNSNNIDGFVYLGEGKLRAVSPITTAQYAASPSKHHVAASHVESLFVQNGPYSSIDSAVHCMGKCASSSPPTHWIKGFSYNEERNSCYCWTTETEEIDFSMEDMGVDWSTKDTFGKTYYQVSNPPSPHLSKFAYVGTF